MHIEGFRAFMEGYVQFMEELARGESEKYASLISYDPKRTEKAVSGQQAMNMRLERMEQQREEKQREAGLEGLSFAEILEKLDGESRTVFEGLFRRFAQAINEVKFFNAKSIAFAQEGMQMLGVGNEKAPYGADGKRPDSAQGTSIFDAQV